MNHRGKILSAADLPRLMRSHKELGDVIKRLKKETGWTSSPTVSAAMFWDSYQIAVRNISAQVTGQDFNFGEDFGVLAHKAAVADRDFARAAELRQDIARRLRAARQRQVYGDRWKILARPDETILVRLAATVCKYVGPRGGEIRYNRDQRLPAAKFWPGGVIPDVKMVVAPSAPPKSTWEGQHPLLVQLQEARDWHEANRDNIREMAKVHDAMDYDANARKHARDRIVHDICEDAARLDYWQSPERETLREAA